MIINRKKFFLRLGILITTGFFLTPVVSCFDKGKSYSQNDNTKTINKSNILKPLLANNDRILSKYSKRFFAPIDFTKLKTNGGLGASDEPNMFMGANFTAYTHGMSFLFNLAREMGWDWEAPSWDASNIKEKIVGTTTKFTRYDDASTAKELGKEILRWETISEDVSLGQAMRRVGITPKSPIYNQITSFVIASEDSLDVDSKELFLDSEKEISLSDNFDELTGKNKLQDILKKLNDSNYFLLKKYAYNLSSKPLNSLAIQIKNNKLIVWERTPDFEENVLKVLKGIGIFQKAIKNVATYGKNRLTLITDQVKFDPAGADGSPNQTFLNPFLDYYHNFRQKIYVLGKVWKVFDAESTSKKPNILAEQYLPSFSSFIDSRNPGKIIFKGYAGQGLSLTNWNLKIKWALPTLESPESRFQTFYKIENNRKKIQIVDLIFHAIMNLKRILSESTSLVKNILRVTNPLIKSLFLFVSNNKITFSRIKKAFDITNNGSHYMLGVEMFLKGIKNLPEEFSKFRFPIGINLALSNPPNQKSEIVGLSNMKNFSEIIYWMFPVSKSLENDSKENTILNIDNPDQSYWSRWPSHYNLDYDYNSRLKTGKEIIVIDDKAERLYQKEIEENIKKVTFWLKEKYDFLKDHTWDTFLLKRKLSTSYPTQKDWIDWVDVTIDNEIKKGKNVFKTNAFKAIDYIIKGYKIVLPKNLENSYKYNESSFQIVKQNYIFLKKISEEITSSKTNDELYLSLKFKEIKSEISSNELGVTIDSDVNIKAKTLYDKEKGLIEINVIKGQAQRTIIIKSSDSIPTLKVSPFKNVTLSKDFQNPEAWSQTIPDRGYEGAIFPEGFKLPNTITEIGDHAFVGAKGAIPLIPDSVTTLGASPFKGAILPEGWEHPKVWKESIPSQGYQGVTFPNDFKIPNTLKKIGQYAFEESKGAIPLIPDSVIKIGFKSFYKTLLPQNWKNPEIWSKKIQKKGYQGVTFPNDFKIPNTVIEIGDYAFEESKGAIPSIPDTVKKIGVGVFKGTTISRDFKYPRAWLSTIPHQSFLEVTFLEGFSIPSTVTEIESYAFARAEGAIPPIPNTVKKIGAGVFEGVVLPKNFKNPEAWSLSVPARGYLGAIFPKGFKLPNTIKKLGVFSFARTKGAIPSLPDSITKIVSYVFGEAILPIGFKIPDSVQSIAARAFFDILFPNRNKWSKLNDKNLPFAGSEIIL